jgi:hydrogenase maturation protein HypF
MTTLSPDSQRWRLRARGAVQGVGFRPWVLQQAQGLGLSGWVRNDAQGVLAELQGAPAALADMAARWRACPLPLARVLAVEQTALAPLAEAAERGLRILPSEHGAALATGLPPDSAPCAACLDELFNPADRRHRHAFINCTHCGPRFSVTRALPYDRPQTSLAGFAMCPACAAEYANPLDRRHHAQPIACPVCGPQLALWDAQGQPLDVGQDPLSAAVARLRAGQVLAVKGVGGYHLVADARQPAVLARLRTAKQRQHKPFALLVPNAASARRWVQLDEDEAALLASPARPILLLPCQPGVAAAHPAIAPGLNDWGLGLPSSPLQWLLLHEALGRPAGAAWREAPHALLWLFTSANAGGEPLVHTEDQALAQLPGLADALLVHDRPIVSPLDDSVRRPLGRTTLGGLHAPFVRRARGHVPEPVALPGVAMDAPSVLATGGWLKNTICLTRGNEAFVSAHVGDLGAAGPRRLLVEAVDRLRQFLGVQPVAVAHDLHPDFFSSQHAQALAAHWGVPALPVQHHVAHGAAVLAEHGHTGPALALVLDGTGLGTDGQVWGGELLRLDPGARMVRLAHLPGLPLPGGDRAAAEPWRIGAALLCALGRGDEVAQRFAAEPAATMLGRLLAAGKAPQTSSAGRLFDAAAALIAGVHHNSHEAHAAMQLEALANRAAGARPWADAWVLDAQGRLQWTGLWARMAAPRTTLDRQAEAAAAFHTTLADAMVAWTAWHARAQGLQAVALGGGCWLNRLLRQAVVAGLTAQGLLVLEARAVPPGDGGLSLGQAAWALAGLPAAAVAPSPLEDALEPH